MTVPISWFSFPSFLIDSSEKVSKGGREEGVAMTVPTSRLCFRNILSSSSSSSSSFSLSQRLQTVTES